jgi:hypothetical protein
MCCVSLEEREKKTMLKQNAGRKTKGKREQQKEGERKKEEKKKGGYCM